MNWLVIMAGGVGERFWPLSRRRRPKQLLALIGRQTMIQQTESRLAPLFPPSNRLVITSAGPAPLLRQQLAHLDANQIIVEPVGRNTAPCIALAAAIVARQDPDAVMVVAPSDSWIGNVNRYRRTVRRALDLARREEVLIPVGVKPTMPHTGFGYIQLGARHGRHFWDARRFVEKPDLATAKKFVASGRYLWNTGMFVWSVRSVIAAYRRFKPEMMIACERMASARSLTRAMAENYRTLEKISVDYAIMEKAGNVVAARGDYAWDDVGDWPALGRHGKQDAQGNFARGRFVGLDTVNCVIVGDDQHWIGTVGIRDLVVVHTPDATLVCAKQDAQRVRDLVSTLSHKADGRRVL